MSTWCSNHSHGYNVSEIKQKCEHHSTKGIDLSIKYQFAYLLLDAFKQVRIRSIRQFDYILTVSVNVHNSMINSIY